MFLFGAGFAFAGLMAVFTRRMAFRAADDAFEAYAGLPALIVGLMALAVGAAAIWSAYLLDLGQWHATASYLTRRPAPVLAVGGLFFIGIGILMLLNPQGHHSWAWRILVYVPRSTVGILVIAAGVAGIGPGRVGMARPERVRRLRRGPAAENPAAVLAGLDAGLLHHPLVALGVGLDAREELGLASCRPPRRRRSRRSASAPRASLSVSRTSALMRSTIACGVPFGANRPTQIDASRSGMPASRGVAHDGSSGDFFAVVMPITLPRPDLMCGIAPGAAITPKCTSPAATAAAAGAPPL